MNRLEIHRDSGFPVQRQTLEFMQEAYRSAIEHLSRTYGDRVILYGVERVGNTWTDGAIIFNGELLQFKGGVNDFTDFSLGLIENVESVRYRTGEVLDAFRTRSVTWGHNFDDEPISAYRRIRRAATGWVNCTNVLGVVRTTPRARINERGRGELMGEFGDFSIPNTGDLSQGRVISIRAFRVPGAVRPLFAQVIPISSNHDLPTNVISAIIEVDGWVSFHLTQEAADSGRFVNIRCEYEL